MVNERYERYFIGSRREGLYRSAASRLIFSARRMKVMSRARVSVRAKAEKERGGREKDRQRGDYNARADAKLLLLFCARSPFATRCAVARDERSPVS